MNTPAHILIGWAAFGRNGNRKLAAAAIVGSILPDLSLYLLAGTSIFVLGISPQRVFDELYFSDAWQTVFSIDNSFIVWGIALALAMYFRAKPATALCAAALLHLALDFPLHHDDGRAHFWPLSDWIFESPYSYWDKNHHAGIVAPIEATIAIACGFLILREGWKRWRSLFAVILMLFEAWALAAGYFFFL